MENHTKRKQMSSAYRYSSSRLALNYYTFYEAVYENASIPQKIKECAVQFNSLLRGFLDGEADLPALNTMRDQVIGVMEVITAYTDCFQIYEYVLNRVERRFTDNPPIKESVQDFAKTLTGVLMQSDDAVIMNSRIQEVMGQLPIRFTKQKFYSLLMERLTVYAGADKASLEDVLYMLRSSSMVMLPAQMQEEQPVLYELLEKLKKTDYRNLDKEQYQACSDSLFLASERLNQEAGLYLMVQELINDLYVLMMTSGEALMDGVESQAVRMILEGIWLQFKEDTGRALADEITEQLECLEGMQETSMERFLVYENEDDAELKVIEKLLSGSSFVRLDEEEKASDPADRTWLEQKGQEFCEELDRLFAGMPKAVVRAVMAKILSYLPVVFRTSQELNDYILGSLESCTDSAEREACMELLKQELIDDDALV